MASIPTRPSEAQNLLEAAVAGVAPLEATDHLGVVHRMWPVTDVAVIATVEPADGPQAGVHRRRPSPLRDGLQLPRRAGRPAGALPPNHPANFVLMMCIGMNDPGLARAAHAPAVPRPAGDDVGRADRQAGRLASPLASSAKGADLAASVWEEIETGDDQGTLGLFTADGRTLGAGHDHRRRPGADGRSGRRAQQPTGKAWA